VINKNSLIRAASKSTGLSLRDTSACIDSIINTLNEAVSHGEKVELRGFGSFFLRITAAKKIAFSNTSPVIPSHGRVVFRPCQKLRLSVWNKVKS
jgi:nucleoid DNA-binding protein